MLNFILFFLTIFVWFGVSHWFIPVKTSVQSLKRIAIISVLSMPFNINGDIYTVIGNAESDTGDVISVSSFYQKAKGLAFTLVPTFAFQEANCCNSFAGVSLYQSSNLRSTLAVGISFCQRAISEDGKNCLGLGVSLYQKSDDNSNVYVGVSAYQSSGKSSLIGIGISGYQNSNNWSAVVVGVSGYQKSLECYNLFALTFFQNEGVDSRTFSLCHGWNKK